MKRKKVFILRVQIKFIFELMPEYKCNLHVVLEFSFVMFSAENAKSLAVRLTRLIVRITVQRPHELRFLQTCSLFSDYSASYFSTKKKNLLVNSVIEYAM